MARVIGDGHTRPSLTSHLRDIRQTGRDVMSVLGSQEADMILANLANGHGTLPFHAKQPFWHSNIYIYICIKKKARKK